MDIKKLQPEAEVAYELETTGDPIAITFRVGFMTLDAIPDYVREGEISRPRVSDVVRRAMADAIHGWDLTDDGKPLACTRENKEKYLPLLFGLKVKRPEKESANPIDNVLVVLLAEFAGTAENFLKN